MRTLRQGTDAQMRARTREWLRIILVVAGLVTSGCGSAKDARTSDASGDTAGLGDGHPHGCHSDEDCGSPVMWSCTPSHSCCGGRGSDCAFQVIGPNSGVTETFTPCHSDDACASNEYCQSDISQCCPVGYLCGDAIRPAVDGAGAE